MGKGQFILALARLNPDINYIGIERYSSVLLRAVEKLEEEVPNLRFICMDAATLPEVFDKNEISRIYLNFSDRGQRQDTPEEDLLPLNTSNATIRF